MSNLLDRKHGFVRNTLAHHGVTGPIHTACVADLIHGLEELDKAEHTPKPIFEIGKIYRMQNGMPVRAVKLVDDLPGYESTLFSDGKHRYSRTGKGADNGRCTGSNHDYSCEFNIARVDTDVGYRFQDV